MKKLGITLVAMTAIACIGSLTSCNNSTVANAGEELQVLSLDDLKTNSSESNKIVVSFWHSFGHNISSELDKLIENFEDSMAEQEIYIDVQANQVGGGYDGLRSRVNMGTKSNSIPTMVLGYPDHFADYINSDILLPIDQYVNSSDTNIAIDDVTDFVASYWDEVKMDMKYGTETVPTEHIVGIPFNKSTEIMYYNSNVVDPILTEHEWISEDGVWENPTWEQLFTVSTELKEKVESSDHLTWTESGVPATATKTTYPVFIDSEANFFITTARQWSNGSDVYTKRNADGTGTVVFDNATTKAAQNYFIEKANANLWNIPKKVNQSYGSSVMQINEAFISIGSTAGVNNNDSTKYNLKCTAIPQRSYEEGAVNAVIQQGTNAAILSKNSNNLTRLSAWLLIRYLTNTENTTAFSMETGYLPVRESAKTSETFMEFLAHEEDPFVGNAAKSINAAYRQLDYFYTDPAFSGSSIVRDTVDTMIQTVYCNNKTIDEAIRTAYSELERQRIATEVIS